jgi:hypothetical protein
MSKSQHKNTQNMKKMRQHTTSKTHQPYNKDLNNSEENDISNFELKRMMRMINEIKEGMHKHLKKTKENTNKHLNEFQENTNKQLAEIKMTKINS